MIDYLIVCPLVFLAGFVDSIAGGGGLISLPAYLIAGLPPIQAIATNKFSSCIGTTGSTARFLFRGYMGKETVLYILLALCGATAGARLATQIDPRIFRFLLLAVLPLVAFVSFQSGKWKESLARRQDRHTNQAAEYSALSAETRPKYWVAALGSLLIGAYDGLYGPGTGTFLILMLSGLARYEIRQAAGTTKAINLASNVASLIVFLRGGLVVFPLAVAAAIFCLGGHLLGAGMVLKGGEKLVKPVILGVLCFLFLKVVWDLLS